MTIKQELLWSNIEEVESDDDDFVLIEKIQNKTDGYGEYVTQDELLKKIRNRI